MKTFIEIFLIGHIVADFLLQSATMAELKKEKVKYWIRHSAIYAAIFFILSFVCLTPKFAIIYSGTIAMTHCIVDHLRIILDKKTAEKPKIQFISFILDQIIHISVIFSFYFFLELNIHSSNLYYKLSKLTNFSIIIQYILLFLLLTSPSAIFVKKLLKMLFFEDKVKNKSKILIKKKKIYSNKDNENPNIGFAIGILERVITAVMLLCNQYSAIGLVLTAKSIARFKQLEDKSFAEKYLIGTLTSLLISLTATIAVKKLL